MEGSFGNFHLSPLTWNKFLMLSGIIAQGDSRKLREEDNHGLSGWTQRQGQKRREMQRCCLDGYKIEEGATTQGI